MANTKNGIYYPNDKTQKATILSDLQQMAESIENTIDKNKFDPAEIKEDISNLESEQTEQDKEIEILTNALPTETVEGESINIKGTIPVKFKEFKVSGNSKQETRSGKNLLEVINVTKTSNGITCTNNKDGSVTLNGIATGNIYYNLNANDDNNTKRYFKLTNGVTYSLLLKNKINGLNLVARSETKNYSLLSLDTSTTVEEVTLTYNRETDEQCFAYLFISNGTTLSNITVYPMLVEGSEIGDWEPYGAMPSPEYPSEIQNVEGDVNVTVANKEKTEQQTVTFPLSKGQKLMKGDYLADDGIHHVRKQIELDGTENWELYSDKAARISRSDVKGVPNVSHIGSILSNFFKTETQADLQMGVADNGIAVRAEGNNGIVIRIAEFTTLQEYKDWLSSKKSEGTPVIAEYELAEEEIEAYTPEQQEAYNQICNLKAYEGETNIYSTNEISPIFKVTAIKDFNSIITQLNTVLLERS